MKDYFKDDNIIEAEKAVYAYLKDNNLTNNIFDDKIKDALKLFAETLDNSCVFNLETNSEQLSANNEISFAPALMLRKINPGGLVHYATELLSHWMKIAAKSLKNTPIG